MARYIAALAAICVAGTAWAQPVPEGLPAKFGTQTVKNDAASCTGESRSCFEWCDKNNPTSTTCKTECTWRIDYCKRTGLYPQQTRPNVWVGKRE